MRPSFLLTYLDAFHRIEGWFSYDAALMFMAYNQLARGHGVQGDVLEIGVHHGLSTIGIAALRGPDRQLYAVDLFDELQVQNVSRSGQGNRSLFDGNLRAFYGNVDFMRVMACASGELEPRELGSSFSFCHIDGGHSRRETYHDLELCHSILLPGGLVALDDYFNVLYPGVCEGAVEFMLSRPDALRPLAIGFNKVLFHKQPASFNPNAEFQQNFPNVPHQTVQLWDQPALLFSGAFRSWFDLQASTPEKLCPAGSIPPRALMVPTETRLEAHRSSHAGLKVNVTNTSAEAFPCGEKVFGLSYHLLSRSGQTLRHDNDRTYFKTPLEPGQAASLDLDVKAPPEPAEYRLEIDLVWENVMWFRDIGNPTAFVDFLVT